MSFRMKRNMRSIRLRSYLAMFTDLLHNNMSTIPNRLHSLSTQSGDRHGFESIIVFFFLYLRNLPLKLPPNNLLARKTIQFTIYFYRIYFFFDLLNFIDMFFFVIQRMGYPIWLVGVSLSKASKLHAPTDFILFYKTRRNYLPATEITNKNQMRSNIMCSSVS